MNQYWQHVTGSAHISVTGSRLYVLELRDLMNSFWPAGSRKDPFSGQHLSWPTPKMWPKFSNYTKCNIIYTPTTCSRMFIRTQELCIATTVSDWCRLNRLQLNAKKTECMYFGSVINLQKIPDHMKPFFIENETLEPVSVVRNLEVLFDEHLSMKAHISNISHTCFFHLPRHRSVRHQLGREITQQLVSAFVLSRLDYCNAVLAGLPDATLAISGCWMHQLGWSGTLSHETTSRQRWKSCIGSRSDRGSNTNSVSSSTCRSTTELRAICATS